MRTLLSAAVAVAIGLAIAPVAAQDMKKVRLGNEGAYPPFNQLDSNGDLTGFDIEIGNALCAAAKFDCEWVVQDWDGIIPGLQAEKYDAIVSSLSITPERAEVVDFTDAYYQEAGAVVGPDDVEFMESLEATVAGKVIGVQSATTHENFVRDVLGDAAGEIKIYDSVEQAHLDLVAGRIDFFSDGLIAVTGGFLETDLGDGHAIIGEPFTHPEIHGAGAGIAVRKGDAELQEAFNAAIKSIREDGTYQKISDKYFGVDIFGE